MKGKKIVRLLVVLVVLVGVFLVVKFSSVDTNRKLPLL